MKTDLEHLSSDQLRAFIWGNLSPAEQARCEQHVAVCDDCCQALEGLPDDPLLAHLRRSDTQDLAGVTEFRPAPGSANAAEAMLSADLASSERLQVVRKLGSGGMGVVYLAEDRLMGRLVAVKLLDSRLLDHQLAGQRFEQEVRAAGKLSHRNIVTAYDALRIGNSPALVMEYIEGQSLDRLVAERGPLPVEQACRYARQAALGLAHAHERGLVHRDIKPHNLMLTATDEIKILDFGLARLVYGDGNQAQSATSLTARGAVLGTPDYIAPEQARDAKGIDHRADIYSLGCTLYFLLAGKPPFAEGSSTEKMANHMLIDPPPLTTWRSDLPPALVDLVRCCMAKKPDDRPQSAAEVAIRLADLPAGDAAQSSRHTTSRRRWLIAAALLLLVCGGSAAAYVGGAFAPAVPQVLILAPRDIDISDYNDLVQNIDLCVLRPQRTLASTVASPGEWFPVALMLDEVDPADYHIAYIIGSENAENSELANDPKYQEEVRRIVTGMLQQGKTVAAHRGGVISLARNGLLTDRNVADCPDVSPATKQASGAKQWLDQGVVVDGTLFTSQAENDAGLLVNQSLKFAERDL